MPKFLEWNLQTLLSRNKIKWIRSLHQKKFRDREGLFLAEGTKIVSEVLESNLEINYLVLSPEFLARVDVAPTVQFDEASKEEIRKASTLQSPPEAIAICRKPQFQFPDKEFNNELVLVLDGIQDPGNLGTLLRSADWFGIENIILSPECADVYNPKVIQASMGAFLRIKFFRTDLVKFFSARQNMPVYGAYMEGESVGTGQIEENSFLILGNEGNGISEKLSPFIDRKISIPRYGKSRTESLNVAVAGGILMASFRQLK